MSAEEDAVTRRVLPNFLAGEEEQPLERQLDLDLNLHQENGPVQHRRPRASRVASPS